MTQNAIQITHQAHDPDEEEAAYRGHFPDHPGWTFKAFVSDDPNDRSDVWFSDGRIQEVILDNGTFRVWATDLDDADDRAVAAMFEAVRIGLEPPAEALGLIDFEVELVIQRKSTTRVKATTPADAEAIARNQATERLNEYQQEDLVAVKARTT